MQPSNKLTIHTLSENWSDKDHVMLHVCFQLLTDRIENENLIDGHVNWTADEEHINVKKEIESLYNWWKIRVKKELDDQLDPIWTENQCEEDTEKLIRLMKVRKFLWT